MRNSIVIFTVFIGLLACSRQQPPFKTELAKLPALNINRSGVSAAFCGLHNGCIIVAGGCNFPGIPAAEGGSKIYYDDIYVLHKDSVQTARWRKVGKLPYPAAYGIALPTDKGILCIGGMNNEKRLDQSFLLQYDVTSHTIRISEHKPLPFAVDNAGGIVCNNAVYICGGNREGVPSNLLLSFDLKKNDAWIVADTLPGYPRVQPILLSRKKNEKYEIIIHSGFYHSADTTIVHTDGYAYFPDNRTWRKLSSPAINSVDVSLSGGIGFTLNDSLSICFGGVNKNVFRYGLEISERYATAKKNGTAEADSLKLLADEYMNADVAYYQFNKNHWLYNAVKDEWSVIGNSQATALAGASGAAIDEYRIVLINGETKPGIRTSKNHLITIK